MKKGPFVSSTRPKSLAVNLEESLYARMLETPVRHSPTSEYSGDRVTASAIRRVSDSALPLIRLRTDPLELTRAADVKPADIAIPKGYEQPDYEESRERNSYRDDHCDCAADPCQREP